MLDDALRHSLDASLARQRLVKKLASQNDPAMIACRRVVHARLMSVGRPDPVLNVLSSACNCTRGAPIFQSEMEEK